MTDAIGGYLGKEPVGEGIFPHQQGVLLNTGRNALEYILRSLPNVRQVYIPFYTCEVVCEPLNKLGIPYLQYHTNERFEIAEDIVLQEDEYIIVNNYFGIKDAYVAEMAAIYGDRLIVDCAQAFFAPVLPNTKMYFSARKFVGVADGGIAYPNTNTDWHHFAKDDSSGRQAHLEIRIQEGAEAGFRAFQENEAKLDNQNLNQMSNQTIAALRQIDYQSIVDKRRNNYMHLHEMLRDINLLEIPDVSHFACPMVYPFWFKGAICLRSELQKKRVFTATYWPNVVSFGDEFGLEETLAKEIIPLPIDQRYGFDEMDKILKEIKRIRLYV